MATILCIDDSESILKELNENLTKNNHTVFLANDGDVGLEKMKEKKSELDLVICDVNMPRMNGITVMENVYNDKDLKKIPVIILTTELDENLQRRGRELGIFSWMRKPCKMEILLSAINKITEKKQKSYNQ